MKRKKANRKSTTVRIKAEDPRISIGKPGSGKTSAVAQLFAPRFLSDGWGGGVLTAKSTDRKRQAEANRRLEKLLAVMKGVTVNNIVIR